MTTEPNKLWRHRDFTKLWTGETISLLGSQITLLALPLTAAIILKATPAQMGFLEAAQFAPFLLIGLFAGVWVDRNRRKPFLMIGDIGRALLLASIPLAAVFNALHIEQLYLVGFLVGILTVFFDVAYQSYLPSLVERANLVEGNSKLEVSRAITQIAGPGFAGIMIDVSTAPLAITLDALSFVVSALFLWRIKTEEPPPNRGEQRHILHEVREGLQVVLGNSTLRSIAFCTGTSNLFTNLAMAVYILYATRELNLGASAIGLIAGIASIGGLLGALYADRCAKRFGLGPTIIGSMLISTLGMLFFPLATGPAKFTNFFVGNLGALLFPVASGTMLVAITLLMIGQFIAGLGGVIYNINQVSLRQTITPHRLLGRMNASMRFIVWGTIPIGALIGGFLGGIIGLRATLLVGAVAGLSSALWVYFSPVRVLREQPAPIDETTDDPVPEGAVA